MTNCKQHNWRRAALALPVLAVSLAFTGAASAQTITFQATVTSSPVDVSGVTSTQPSCAPTIPAVAGEVKHLFCGNANIAGYGPAHWTLNAYDLSWPSSGCLGYKAITTFQLPGNLAHPDGSTLVLDENGTGCAPGSSGSSAGQDVFVAPLFSSEPGSWWVETTGNDASLKPPYGVSTGVFAGMAGCGTDTLQSTGPRTTGTYTETPCPQPSS